MLKSTQQLLKTSSGPKTKLWLALGYLSILGGALLLGWSLFQIVEGSISGNLDGAISYPLSLSIGCILFGVLVLTTTIKFAGLFLIALAGQASTLRLIDAGKAMHYQHYLLDRATLQAHIFSFGIIVLQTIIIGFVIWQNKGRILAWLRRQFRWWQLLLAFFAFAVLSATVSPDVGTFIRELVFAGFIQTVNLANVLLLALVMPENLQTRITNLLNKFFDHKEESDGTATPRIDRFALVVGIWVIVISAFLNLFAYQRHPHIPDEVAYIYHARYLADGKLYTAAPPVQDAFDVYLMQFDGDRWYPAPPIGWPMILAIGELVGLPWLVNPVLGGINILLAYLLLTELYSRRLAKISIFLLAISPWYVFMAMNFMTHMFTLTCALTAALGLVWARKTGRIRWILLSGFALGVMSLIRPLEALIWALLIGLWAIGFGGKRIRISWLAALVITTGLTASLVLPYNKLLTGSASIFPINQYTDQRFGHNSNAYGFGPDRGMGWPIDPNMGHDPIDAMINADLNGFSINIELFGWSIGSLLFVILFVLSGRFQKSDYLMFAVITTVFIAFFFYYFSGGPDFGARYWFLMIVPLVVLTVRGIQSLENRLNSGGLGSSSRVLAVLLLAGVLALINYFPWRAIDKYYHYLNMRPDIRELAEDYHFGRSLVLIDGDEHPDYASAFVYNPVDMQADAPIYAWDRDPETRQQVLRAYQDRPVWIIAGPTITHAGYQIIEGPVPASELLAEEGTYPLLGSVFAGETSDATK